MKMCRSIFKEYSQNPNYIHDKYKVSLNHYFNFLYNELFDVLEK